MHEGLRTRTSRHMAPPSYDRVPPQILKNRDHRKAAGWQRSNDHDFWISYGRRKGNENDGTHATGELVACSQRCKLQWRTVKPRDGWTNAWSHACRVVYPRTAELPQPLTDLLPNR